MWSILVPFFSYITNFLANNGYINQSNLRFKISSSHFRDSPVAHVGEDQHVQIWDQ